MKKRAAALLLSLSMLICAGCGGEAPERLKTPPEDTRLSQPEEPPEEQPEDAPEDGTQESPEPMPLVWTTEPVLPEEELPGSYHGLELPVQGATGYTSTKLPLWASPEDSAAAKQAFADWEQRQEEAAARKAAEQAAAAASEAGGSPAEAPEDTELPDQPETGDAAAEDPPEESPPLPPENTGELPSSEPPAGTPEVPAGPTVSQPPEPETPPVALEPESIPVPEPEPESVPVPVPEPEPEPEPAPSLTEGALTILPAGTAMTVLGESGEWWKVRCGTQGGLTGWIEHKYCFINLPDVIPSIIFNATNAYSSRFVSCGKTLENITGKQLYTGKTFNSRLGEDEFMMPVLYSMAFRLCAAQRAALKEGNSLVLYEGYRPQETQMKVSGALRTLMRQDSEVQAAITAPPWGISWFIATSTSNHQWGYAVDVSLARVMAVEVQESGGYAYTRVRACEEYEMPTPIHELSPAAATFTTPVGPNSATSWKSAKLTDSMAASESALGLQGYCTGAGLSPLASEWWHFNDLASRANVLDNLGSGGFEITSCLSAPP